MNNITENYIFISYSHRDDINSLIKYLDKYDYNYIYDVEMSVGTDWEIKARRYISNEKCAGVVVCLGTNSIKSKPVLRELDLADVYSKPIMPLIMDFGSMQSLVNYAMEKNDNENDQFVIGEISRYFSPETIYITCQQLADGSCDKQIEKTFAKWNILPNIKEATMKHSTYKSDYPTEKRRLEQQRLLFRDTDRKCIQSIINSINSDTINILDVGCNDGGQVIPLVKDISDKKINIMGIDINNISVNNANKEHSSESFVAYCIDCISETFLSDMNEIMKNRNIKSFDIAVCSFSLLHMDDPFRCLSNVRKLLSHGGYIYIRDIDDELSISYPDPEKLVATFQKHSSLLSFTGKRLIGREIYSLLIKASFRDVKAIPEEITTMSKDADYLDVLFDVNFKYIIVGLEQKMENSPQNAKIKDEFRLAKEAYQRLEDLFHTPGYYYRMGTMIFIARR